jgi:hypothetical protein
MSLPVWPSAFIRFAVVMCSASSTLRGRPNFVPFVRETCRFSAVRSLTYSRSYPAREPKTPIIMRPVAVEESIPSVVDTSVTPRSVSALTVSRMCSVLRPKRPHHHGVALANVSHQLGQARSVISRTRHDVGERLRHACGAECSLLLIQSLGHRAYPHVPDPLAFGHYAGRLRHKATQRGIRDRYF